MEKAKTAPEAVRGAEWPGFSRGMGIGGWLTNYKRFNVLPEDKRLLIRASCKTTVRIRAPWGNYTTIPLPPFHVQASLFAPYRPYHPSTLGPVHAGGRIEPVRCFPFQCSFGGRSPAGAPGLFWGHMTSSRFPRAPSKVLPSQMTRPMFVARVSSRTFVHLFPTNLNSASAL